MKIKRAVQVALLLLVLTSGVLLGLSQRSLELTLVATIGGLAGFIISDWLRLFHLKGVLANAASVVVLIFAMKDFLGADGASKLISVSNLLVYLQTVLMFQEKTPRLNWQLFVLSLLQIVVAAIFNLNFEGGLLFVMYFAVAGVALILQSVYANQYYILEQNKRAAEQLAFEAKKSDKFFLGTGSSTHASGNQPITIFDTVPQSVGGFRRMFRHLVLWLGGALVFSTILFYIIPRGEQAWFGPSFVPTSATGKTKAVDLDERGIIQPSARMVMRVWFDKRLGISDYVEVQPKGPIYFRGMALSSLVIKDGKTTWEAPYDRIYSVVYQALRKPETWTNALRVRGTLQPTNDPLIHTPAPFYGTQRTLSEIEYCYELSAVSRRNGNDRIETTPYNFELKTFQNAQGELLDAWPYITDKPAFISKPMMTDNPGQYRWLTDMEPERYPNIVKVADQLADRNQTSQMELMRAMEKYFSQPNTFRYTTNFTDVDFGPDSVDPIEDFFGNHRCGHCELYASALTLMLRSQGIPARLVVGFYVPKYDDTANCYVVRENGAHAWVEAYVPPEECTDQMLAEGSAGRGGAWLRLDPTPPSELETPPGGGNAIESARTLWQDYVLGLDSTRQDETVFGSSSARILGLFDLSEWNQRYQSTSEELGKRPILRATILFVILCAVLFALFKSLTPTLRSQRSNAKQYQVSGIRRLLGGALSLISPQLGKWMLGPTVDEISAKFYRRLTDILKSSGLEREPSQTHRDFAKQIIHKYSDHEQHGEIKKTVHDLTELFYEVRFGEAELDAVRRERTEQELDQLEQFIGQPAG